LENDVTPLLTAALGYARAGIPVLPIHTPTPAGGCSCSDRDCASPGKHPRVRRGVHAATTDPDVIRGWWTRWPTANIGLRTGVLVDVCDVDTPDARPRVTTLLIPGCSAGPLATTGRGWHLWFAATGAGNHAGILDGVDWRGRDGTIVAPPSLHASGVRYRWVRDHEHPLPACPPRLLALVRRPPPTAFTPGSVDKVAPYAAAALAAETHRVLTARPPTSGMPGVRNDTLNRAAFSLGQLVGARMLDEHTVRTHLTEAALTVGLPASEARRTIASGLTAGQRSPRRTIARRQ
jgi:hypothetical protein